MDNPDDLPNESQTSQNLSPVDEVLTERQRVAIALLVSGKTQSAVAAELGLNRRTLWEWKQDSEFLYALHVELEQIRAAAKVRMFALMDKAFATLEHVLDHGYTDAERLAAVRLVLTWIEPSR